MAVGEWRAGDEKSTLQMMCVVVGEEMVVVLVGRAVVVWRERKRDKGSI
jgi:hypothetical protein